MCCAQEGEAKELQRRLQHMVWSPRTITVQYPEDHDMQSYGALCTHLGTLRGLQLDTDASGRCTVRLDGWALTQDAMDALRTLPSYTGTLDLSACKLSLNPHEYTQLGSHIPTSFTEWDMGVCDAGVVFSICSGVEKRREGLGIGRLKLLVKGAPWQAFDVGAHVVVRGYGTPLVLESDDEM